MLNCNDHCFQIMFHKIHLVDKKQCRIRMNTSKSHHYVFANDRSLRWMDVGWWIRSLRLRRSKLSSESCWVLAEEEPSSSGSSLPSLSVPSAWSEASPCGSSSISSPIAPCNGSTPNTTAQPLEPGFEIMFFFFVEENRALIIVIPQWKRLVWTTHDAPITEHIVLTYLEIVIRSIEKFR